MLIFNQCLPVSNGFDVLGPLMKHRKQIPAPPLGVDHQGKEMHTIKGVHM